MDEIISEKKDRDAGSSSCSKTVERQLEPRLRRSREGGEGRTLRMLIAKGTLPHIGQLDGSLGTSIHKPVAANGMELGCRDDLSELFHVRRLDVDYVEALVLDIEVPEVDPQVVTADECFAIAIH